MTIPDGPKPGDVVVRRPREAELEPVRIRVEPRTISVRGATSPMILVYSFFVVTLIGAFLLALPIASSSESAVPPLDAVFTAFSAITGTGIVLVDSADGWTLFGEIIIGVLIFIGGLGFMTGAAFFFLVYGRRAGLQSQIVMSAGLGESEIGRVTRIARNMVLMAVIVQALGTVALFIRWYVIGKAWEGLDAGQAIWQSIFTSFSAFNTAGFDLIPDDLTGGSSMAGFAGDIPTLTIVGVLIMAGSLSYATLADVTVKRNWRDLRLDSKLVLTGTAVALSIGFLAFVAFEWSNPGTIGNDSIGRKISQGLFHTINRTSGFSSFDYSEMGHVNNAVTNWLMFVGGASASTAAGIKVNTLMVIVFGSYAVIRGRSRTTAFNREISLQTVRRGLVVAASAVMALALLIGILFALDPSIDTRAGIFEMISAFGNTGWSEGAATYMNSSARMLLAAAMFIGRFGPLTIALYIAFRSHTTPARYPQEHLRMG
jgi:trk system potassium uptake protein TrkH